MKAYPHYTEFWKIFQIFIAEVWAAGVSHYPSFLFDTREPNLPIVAGAIAGAAYYVALWYSFPVSGAQVSPTFTLAALITRRLPLYLAPVYIIADFLGALLAISISWSVTPYADQAPGTYGMTLPGKGISNVAATMTEAGSTFILISVGLASLDELRDREWRPEYGSPFPLAIMLTIMVNVATTIHISGASMNPTRSLAAAIIQNNYDRLWIYFAGPFLGTVVACFFYEFFMSSKASLRRTHHFLCSKSFDRRNPYDKINSKFKEILPPT